MEHYTVSARKYRPSTFASVVGQPALTATLKNAIATDRLAHAYLFCGSRGVGKTSCARIFAKTINCQNLTPDGEACNECRSCREFNEGRSLNVIELDAASHNGIEDIRQMIEQVQLPPSHGRYRVFVIDEVHMLSTAAFNAFLKTLEEPPEYVIFILATTEKHKIIPTILSRCQIFDFNRIGIRDMVNHLTYVASQEGYTAEPAALGVIAAKADGAMRDALSIFDQVAASSRGNITYQSTIENLNVLDHAYYKNLIDAFMEDNVPQALLIYKEIRDKGFDSQFFINGMATYFRDLMLASNPQTLPLLEVPDDVRDEYAAEAAKCTAEYLYKAMDLCNTADLNYRLASDKQFLVELTLIKLCQPAGPSHGISGDGEGQLEPIAARPDLSNDPLAPKAATAPKQPAAPAAAPAARAVSTPTQSAHSYTPSYGAAAPRAKIKLGGTGLSLRGLHSDAPEDAQHADAPKSQTGNTGETFTADDVAKAWKAYIESHDTQHLLVNVMRNSSPVPGEGLKYTLALDNNVQTELVTENIADILAYMRHQLRNDGFAMELTITDGLASPTTWTEREVLEHMKQENPDFATFVNDMKLTLL